MRLGVHVYGTASVAAGVLDLVWREFEPAHQPIQAWGDHIPGVTVLAIIAAVWLIAGGVAVQWRPIARVGAAMLAVLYAIFAIFPVPRLYTAPHYLGQHAAVYIGVLGSIAQQLILAVAAVTLWATLSRPGSLPPFAARLCRWVFGLCSIDFGLVHLTGIPATAAMIPKWMPLGGAFWTVLTGIAFVLAGLAILSGVLDVWASRLLGLMLLVFSVVVLTPMIFAAPHNHVAWGGDAYNLTVVGAAWIFANWLEMQRRPVGEQPGAKLNTSPVG